MYVPNHFLSPPFQNKAQVVTDSNVTILSLVTPNSTSSIEVLRQWEIPGIATDIHLWLGLNPKTMQFKPHYEGLWLNGLCGEPKHWNLFYLRSTTLAGDNHSQWELLKCPLFHD